jgi:hypothetical protein
MVKDSALEELGESGVPMSTPMSTDFPANDPLYRKTWTSFDAPVVVRNGFVLPVGSVRVATPDTEWPPIFPANDWGGLPMVFPLFGAGVQVIVAVPPPAEMAADASEKTKIPRSRLRPRWRHR